MGHAVHWRRIDGVATVCSRRITDSILVTDKNDEVTCAVCRLMLGLPPIMTENGGARVRAGPRRPRPVKPDAIVVRHDGREYERDLAKCRRILLQRATEGDFDTMEQFAKIIRLSSTTVSTWLSGKSPGTKKTTKRILRGLRLDFNDVHTPVQQVSRGAVE